jgi:hypothetical protein
MTTPYKHGYALGLEVHNDKGHKVFEHPGSIDGFNNLMAYYPDDKLSVIVLSNKNGLEAAELTPKLASIARGEKIVLPFERKSISVEPAILQQYVGTYRLAGKNGRAIKINLAAGHITAQLSQNETFSLFAESVSRFFLKAEDAELEFFKNSKGEVSHLVLKQSDEDSLGDRIISASTYRR